MQLCKRRQLCKLRQLGIRLARKMADKSAEKSKGQKAKSKAKSRTNVFSCSICDETIKEPSGKAQGEDSIFCDGQCKAWLHRRCAGLSIARFQAVSDSKDPFYCPACRLQSNETEIASLKADIGILAKQLAEIQSRLEPAPPNCKASTPSAEVTNQPQSLASCNQTTPTQKSDTSKPTQRSSFEPNRKYHVVIYGLKEHPQGTPPYKRLSEDCSSAHAILSTLHSTVTDQSICDCSRLGKFTPNINRPLLVKLARSNDVASILANRKKLVDSRHDQISIKPFMSPDERRTESLLLKERRSLITSGTNSKQIRIRNNRIYVRNILHGQVISGKFESPTSPSIATSPTATSQPTPTPITNID